jgi:hypothetical protein
MVRCSGSTGTVSSSLFDRRLALGDITESVTEAPRNSSLNRMFGILLRPEEAIEVLAEPAAPPRPLLSRQGPLLNRSGSAGVPVVFFETAPVRLAV